MIEEIQRGMRMKRGPKVNNGSHYVQRKWKIT